MASFKNSLLPTQILDVLPNPILVKNSSLEYVWVNQAFEELFSIKKEDLIGRLDKELFPDRQVSNVSFETLGNPETQSRVRFGSHSKMVRTCYWESCMTLPK